MDPTENLHTLHGQEEKLRAQSLEAIKARGDLSDHWSLISEAMNVTYAFAHDHEHESEDELTLQFLGIRLFNAAGASIKLGLSGYYQRAFDQVRDVLETGFLINYFTSYPAKIAEWRAADQKARIAHFGPGKIRTALDRRDGYTSGARKAIYDLLSESATHASYRGFGLVTNSKNLGEVGPFFDQKKLVAWLQEFTKHIASAALSLAVTHEGSDLKLAMTRLHYCEVTRVWQEKYMKGGGSY